MQYWRQSRWASSCARALRSAARADMTVKGEPYRETQQGCADYCRTAQPCAFSISGRYWIGTIPSPTDKASPNL